VQKLFRIAAIPLERSIPLCILHHIKTLTGNFVSLSSVIPNDPGSTQEVTQLFPFTQLVIARPPFFNFSLSFRRLFILKLSPSITSLTALWTRWSIAALPIRGFSNIMSHSEKSRLLVKIIGSFSYRLEMSSNRSS